MAVHATDAVIASDGDARPRALWPLLVPMALLWTVIAGLLLLSLGRTEGHLVYALDDPYIHMAMARNVALHGVWGVTPDGFTSSSSSIAWTAVLSLLLVSSTWSLVALAAGAAFFTVRDRLVQFYRSHRALVAD